MQKVLILSLVVFSMMVFQPAPVFADLCYLGFL